MSRVLVTGMSGTGKTAVLDVLLHRVASRTSNPYGRSVADRARSGHHVRTVEPQLRWGASLELDTRRPLDELADAVERLILAQPDRPRPRARSTSSHVSQSAPHPPGSGTDITGTSA